MFVFGNYFACGAQSEGHSERLLVKGLLEKHHEMRLILPFTQVSTFQ